MRVLVGVLAAGLMLVGCGSPPEPEPSGSLSIAVAPDGDVTPGTTDQTVAPGPKQPTVTVGLGAPAVDGKVVIKLVKLTRTKVDGLGPGEISGPALAVEVQVRNRGDDPLNLDLVVVTVIDSKGQTAAPMTGSPARPMAGSLAAGKSASGTYVFAMTSAAKSSLKVWVNWSPARPKVVFAGRV